MGAPVRIEDDAFSDLRYEVLATLCQLADADHARGKMAVLWRQCTAHHVYVLHESIVNAVLGPRGAVSIVEAGLGEVADGGIRIRGTKGRIEWLKRLKKNASKGGKAKAAKRHSRRQSKTVADGAAEPAKDLASPCPLTLTLTPTLSSSESAPAAPDWQAVVDQFDGYYRRLTGAKPTWEGRQFKTLKKLVDAHGHAEVIRRVRLLEQSPPQFPPQPWDMATLSQHFDKIAIAPAQNRNVPVEPVRHIPMLGRPPGGSS